MSTPVRELQVFRRRLLDDSLSIVYSALICGVCVLDVSLWYWRHCFWQVVVKARNRVWQIRTPRTWLRQMDRTPASQVRGTIQYPIGMATALPVHLLSGSISKSNVPIFIRAMSLSAYPRYRPGAKVTIHRSAATRSFKRIRITHPIF